VAVWGVNGNCAIPDGATALSMNVVSVNPSGASYLTVFPADEPRPLSSSLNWVGGQAPTPNAVTVAVSEDGRIAFYNNAGTVDLAVDVVGYYEPAGSEGGVPGPPGVDAPRPARVVSVASSGGDFTSVGEALASIVDNSAANPYLIEVAPGTYVEPAGIDLKDYVDIEGSGQAVTTISSSSAAVDNTTVRAAGVMHGEIRDLTIVNTAGGDVAVGLRITGTTPAAAFRVTNVTVNTTGTDVFIENNVGSNYGTYVQSADPIITGLTTTAAYGRYAFAYINNGASPTMTDITATATGATFENYGIFNQNAASPDMADITANATGLVNEDPANWDLMFGPGANYAVYNSGGAPIMTDIIATSSVAANSYGVFNNYSSPIMTNVTATGRGGVGYANLESYGVYNLGGAPKMTDVAATADRAQQNYGVYNDSTTPTMTDVTATAAADNFGDGVGVYNTNAALTMTNIVARGRVAVHNLSSTVTMTNVRAMGDHTSSSHGVLVDGGQVLIRDAFLSGTVLGSPSSAGHSVDVVSGAVKIFDSLFNGDTSGVGAANCVNAMTPTLAAYSCI